jgi:DNA-binding response OmpR family regulator
MDRQHVLIVEDAADVRDVLQEILQSGFYAVTPAATIKEAREVLRSSHVDLVLVDSILPDGRGDEIILTAADLSVPSIMMSGYPQEIACMENSGGAYLAKPFKSSVLLAEIRRILRTLDKVAQ